MDRRLEPRSVDSESPLPTSTPLVVDFISVRSGAYHRAARFALHAPSHFTTRVAFAAARRFAVSRAIWPARAMRASSTWHTNSTLSNVGPLSTDGTDHEALHMVRFSLGVASLRV